MWRKLCMLGVVCAAPAFGKLGETIEQVQARYGPPINVNMGVGELLGTFRFREYEIEVHFQYGIDEEEFIQNSSGEGSISKDEASLLVESIGGCKDLERRAVFSGYEWTGTNGVVAFLRVHIMKSDTLLIMSAKAWERWTFQQELKAREKARAFGGKPVVSPSATPIITISPEESLQAKARQAEKDRLAEISLLKFQLGRASNGSAYAQCALGKRYLEGKGVPKDEALARSWLEKSAAQGDEEAKAALRKLPPAR
jgi:hypothetical protein